MRALPLLAALVALSLPAASLARESSPEQRRGIAKPTWGFRLGAATATSSASPDTLTAMGGGGYAMFDIPDLLADVSLDVFAGESRARMVAGGIGVYVPLADGETVPYAGGGLKLGWTRFGGDGAFGMLPFGAVGLLVGRSWSPQIRLEASWFFQTGTERRAPGAPTHHSNGPILTIGMAF